MKACCTCISASKCIAAIGDVGYYVIETKWMNEWVVEDMWYWKTECSSSIHDWTLRGSPYFFWPTWSVIRSFIFNWIDMRCLLNDNPWHSDFTSNRLLRHTHCNVAELCCCCSFDSYSLFTIQLSMRMWNSNSSVKNVWELSDTALHADSWRQITEKKSAYFYTYL